LGLRFSALLLSFSPTVFLLPHDFLVPGAEKFHVFPVLPVTMGGRGFRFSFSLLRKESPPARSRPFLSTFHPRDGISPFSGFQHQPLFFSFPPACDSPPPPPPQVGMGKYFLCRWALRAFFFFSLSLKTFTRAMAPSWFPPPRGDGAAEPTFFFPPPLFFRQGPPQSPVNATFFFISTPPTEMLCTGLSLEWRRHPCPCFLFGRPKRIGPVGGFFFSDLRFYL